eukprot:scaffold266021_cov13-Prasinocladus_malaysianus.AAC.1
MGEGSMREADLAPAVKVQRRELGESRLDHVDIERLALVDKGPAVGCHVHKHPLLDFPHGFVNSLQPVQDQQPANQEANKKPKKTQCMSR